MDDPSILQTGLDPARLQADYLEALVKGSRRQAEKVVQQGLDEGMSAGDIYLSVFQNAAHDIGQLWQQNRISIAQEHLATAIIERQMSDLHPYFKPAALRYKTVVIGCVEQEFHTLGANMVADFFEQDGWNVIFLGANVPNEAFISMIRDLSPDLIGISAQMTIRLPALNELVSQLVRQGLGGIPVMAGGQPFLQQPDLAHSLGVNFIGIDARAAVTLADEWMVKEG